MAAVPKVLLRTAPTTTAATTGTVPTGYRWIVTNVIVSNTSGAAATFTMLLDGVNLVTTSVAAGAQFQLTAKQVLDAGKVLSVASGTASTLAIHVSGIEQGI